MSAYRRFSLHLRHQAPVLVVNVMLGGSCIDADSTLAPMPPDSGG